MDKMNMGERNIRLNDFFKEGCMPILEKKGKDYNPTNEAFTDIVDNARAIGVTPEQVLIVFMSKHWAAIQSHAKSGQVASEPIVERCKDLANYCAMYAVYQQSKPHEPMASQKGSQFYEEVNKKSEAQQNGEAEKNWPVIVLTRAEVASGLDRVRAAELLIEQLPKNHEGRNTWLMTYGKKGIGRVL